MPKNNSKKYTHFYSKYNDTNEDQKLLQPCLHLEVARLVEENFVIKIFKAFNYWLKIPETHLKEIFSIVEMMYCREIVIDDIQDGTTFRNGSIPAHLVYGIPNTINATAYLTFIMVEKLLDFKNPLKAIQIHIEQSLECCRGQGIEIYWRDNFICPTEEEYKNNIHRKTSSFILNGVLLMQLFSENKKDFTKLAKLIGLFFQIHNDYINLTSTKYMESKGYCEDISEGKFSFPIIHAIHSRPEDNRILHILKQKTQNEVIKNHCLSLLEKFGSLNYTKETIMQLKSKISVETKSIGDNPLMLNVIEEHYNSFLDNDIEETK